MEYAALPKQPGVYLLTNLRTGRYYVGSSKDIYRRVQNHLSVLRRGSHGNPYLQRSFSKYGEDAFAATVLELCSNKTDLVACEQKWLNLLCDKRRSFNIMPSAYSTSGYERPPASAESLEKASWAKSSPIQGFITPEGHELTILNLGLFCRERNLSSNAMRALANGLSTSYREWTHHNGKPKQRDWIRRQEGFIDPEGNEVPPFENMEQFCRERGLDASTMRKLASGKKPSHHGWTHRNSPQPVPFSSPKKAARYIGFISPQGEAVVIENLSAFCRENGLAQSAMQRLAYGKGKTHKGWTFSVETGAVEYLSRTRGDDL